VTTTDTDERVAIRAAMERLLSGEPTNSTGALTVLQLAAEAGVKRWVLTHKHTDLREEFHARRIQANGVPAAYQHLHARLIDLTGRNEQLRADKAELEQQVAVYAQLIHELATANARLRTVVPAKITMLDRET
jgi:7-keto-8-aminopelargonate synthetase-like enzyme